MTALRENLFGRHCNSLRWPTHCRRLIRTVLCSALPGIRQATCHLVEHLVAQDSHASGMPPRFRFIRMWREITRGRDSLKNLAQCHLRRYEPRAPVAFTTPSREREGGPAGWPVQAIDGDPVIHTPPRLGDRHHAGLLPGGRDRWCNRGNAAGSRVGRERRKKRIPPAS